ncbi:neurobeachin-like protein 1 [Haliotis asinina]|uniref:neurobeachin-like protein 1 n=1 Tax=Haliotis asinina TaxID=109174 RepID=UPI0035322F8D
MDELNAKENLFQLWMIYTAKNDIKNLREFISFFLETYKDLVDVEFDHLSEGFSEEGPHLTRLPDGILEILGNYLSKCSEQFLGGFNSEALAFAESILKCLIVMCRNYDNVPLVASCEFVSHTVVISTSVVDQICRDSDNPAKSNDCLFSFVKHTLHLFECLYDPYFIWRKKLKCWKIDNTRLKFRPALLHNEVVPFFHDCFQKDKLSTDIQLRLLHIFGAIMSGAPHNALKAITPATLDVLLKILSTNQKEGPTNEQRQERLCLKDLVLKNIVRMVHTIHCCSPDQRQVEVIEVMQGYMQVLLALQKDVIDAPETEHNMQLTMINTINEMMVCNDRAALQVLMVSGGTFNAFISLLQQTSLTGAQAQQLAMSVIRVMQAILSGSSNAKLMFKTKVGYIKFVEVLKSLGQPSVELLKSVLNLVVEGEFSEKEKQIVHNTQAALMLLQWLPDIQSHDLQVWVSERLKLLCGAGQRNRMNCCNESMISTILMVLDRERQIDHKAVGHLIGLLESLGTHSVTASELKQLTGHLRLDEEEKQRPYCTRFMRAVSTMARREGREGALHFFDIQEPADGISLPGIRKWPGSGYAVHAWLCLDVECDVTHHNLPDRHIYRRQLYNFPSTGGNGFEAFFTPDGLLVVAVYNKKEYSSVLVPECPLRDGQWHCVDIVHTSSRRPFTQSQLTVYIDGKQKLNTQLKFPSLSESFTHSRIGSPGLRSTMDILMDMSQTDGHSGDHKKQSTLKSLFQSATRSSTHQPGIDSIPGGKQDEVLGPPISIHGQIGSICVFHDALQPGQVRTLYSQGPNHMNIFSEDPEVSDLLTKLVVHYNGKACKENVCVDLSPYQNHGHFTGQRCVTWDIKDVINCIGGIQVLFPLLEQVDKSSPARQDSTDTLSPDSSVSEETDDWVIVPSSSYADTKLEQNQVAAFLNLLRNMLQTKMMNQDTFIRTHGAATVGALLQKVDQKLVDVNVLMAVQLLVESCASFNKTLLQHLYQFVLFDFRVWSKSDFPVRIGHIQYLSTIIKDDRKYFRKKYGVQYILDTIRTYYSSSLTSGLSEEDSKTIRVSLFNLIKFYIIKDITVEELAQMISFLTVVKEENLICECLDVFLSLLESRKKHDQLYLLLFEPEMAEMLYVLLTYKNYSVIYYEKIVKVLHILLKSDRVYEKSKQRLRLSDCGHLGLISLMQGYDLSVPMIRRFVEQVSFVETSQTYNAILSILTLIHNSGLDIRLEASRQLLSILVSKPGAAKGFAKQLCWQDTIARLLIQEPLTGNSGSASQMVNPVLQVSEVREEALGGAANSNFMNGDLTQRRRSGQIKESALRPDALDISNNSAYSEQGSTRTPMTPLFIQSQRFDDLNMSEEERSRSMSRSSSTSVEDLSAIGQRAADCKDSLSQSQSSMSLSESISDLAMEAGNDSRRASVAQAENFQRALDNLGIQKMFVRDTVEQTEELCQNVLIILLTVMWKGMDGSDKNVWRDRGEVFACIDHICDTHVLVRPKHELKRRLLEMMLHSCTSDIKDTGQPIAVHTENAIELVRIVRNFVTDDSCDNEVKYSERLLEDVMCLLDTLGVWEVETGLGWKEMVHLGLSILLAFAKHPNLDMCAVATARLHALVQTKLISSSAEASYIIGTLNSIIIGAVDENTDNYSFLVPVLKALVDKAHTLLNIEVNLPNLPQTTMSPTFFDDFRSYCHTEEWKTFVTNYIYPQRHHFVESSFSESHTATNGFWRECHENMMLNMHKRNRDIGDSKLKFQAQVLDPFKTKSSQEFRRYQNVSTQLRNQHLSTLRKWRANKRFFTGERGSWHLRDELDIHWKLSNQENFMRMKVKVIQNYNFDPHTEASRQRDNLGVSDLENPEVKTIKVAKEALVSKENIADDALGDEDWNVISASSTASEEYVGKEKLVLSEECDLVTLVEVIKGRLEVTTTHVYFFDCSFAKEEGGEDFKWALSELREIHFRRYNLRRSALEMFLIDQTNYFINLPNKQVRNKIYSRILSLRPSNLSYYGTRSPAELLKASGLTQKWVQREISNFEYLMQLNTIAGRTYNDLSQYPVFPWILRDYTSPTLDLENPKVYRDLSKPMGVINPKNEHEVREKYETFEDPTGNIEKFHYGTHYSNAASVMHYMVRMEPFTSLHIQLQSGKFDVADRQFHSIPGSWQSLYENPNDVKELIPEFFYLPEFLMNSDEFDLGRLQLTKERVGDVILPPWASTPEEFINLHREALESEFVSRNLHHWIDLIFGYKQKGPAAVDALNVFYYCTYEGAVDLDAIENEKERKALEGMINNFGQTPTQLLKEPHPRRLALDDAVTRAAKTGRPLSIFNFLSQLKPFFVEVSNDQDPMVYVNIPRSQFRSIIQHGMPDSMITVTENGIIGIHGWLPFDKSISNYYTFEKDPSMFNAKTKKRVGGPFAPGIRVVPKLFAVSHDAKLLFSVGYWDNSLQVYHLGKAKRINHIVRHIDIVTCLALDYCGNHLITGSRDTTCMIWEILQQGGVSSNVYNKPVQTLYGHDAEVTSVHISVELDLALSASKDGSVIIHTVRKGHYMRTLRPPSDPGSHLSIPLMVVSEIGQILLYCQEYTSTCEEHYTLHLYSVNGKHLFTEEMRYPLGHMAVAGQYLVAGDCQGHLMIKQLFGLKNLTTLQLLVPIQCLTVTNGNSHILAGLRDGKLIIVGTKGKPEIR